MVRRIKSSKYHIILLLVSVDVLIYIVSETVKETAVAALSLMVAFAIAFKSPLACAMSESEAAMALTATMEKTK